MLKSAAIATLSNHIKHSRSQYQLWSKTLAGGKDWNHGAGLHVARIEFSYFAGPAVRENEPLGAQANTV